MLRFFFSFQQRRPDIQKRGPLLRIALLLQCTVKADIKQGANKCNYGRLVGKRSREEETWCLQLWCGLCGFTTHTPHAQKSQQECISPSAFYGNHYDAQHTSQCLIEAHFPCPLFTTNCATTVFAAVLPFCTLRDASVIISKHAIPTYEPLFYIAFGCVSKS